MKARLPLLLGAAAILLGAGAYIGGRAVYRHGYSAGLVSARFRMSYPGWRFSILREQALKRAPGTAMVIGDSIVERQNFTSLCGLPVFNAGVSAATVEMLADQIEPVVAAGKPALIIVAVGINDARNGVATPLEAWRSRYRKLLSQLGDAPVMIVGVQPTEEARTGRSWHHLDLVSAQNAMLPALAGEFGAIFVPPLPDASGLTTDGTHLNGEGDRLWQAAVQRACPK